MEVLLCCRIMRPTRKESSPAMIGLHIWRWKHLSYFQAVLFAYLHRQIFLGTRPAAHHLRHSWLHVVQSWIPRLQSISSCVPSRRERSICLDCWAEVKARELWFNPTIKVKPSHDDLGTNAVALDRPTCDNHDKLSSRLTDAWLTIGWRNKAIRT